MYTMKNKIIPNSNPVYILHIANLLTPSNLELPSQTSLPKAIPDLMTDLNRKEPHLARRISLVIIASLEITLRPIQVISTKSLQFPTIDTNTQLIVLVHN